MKLLYGSQNFGYDTSESDKDWVEIIYPTWKDIVRNEATSTEHIAADNSHTKILDIRLLPNRLNSEFFGWLQILYSKETYGIEDLAWFIRNRDRICRANKYRCYKSNAIHNIRELKDSCDEKTLTRGYVTAQLLKRIISSGKFEFYNPEARMFREWAKEAPLDARRKTADSLIKDLTNIEDYFIDFKDIKDLEIIQGEEDEVIRLLKARLM
jgi:hypothetical protein